MDRKWIDPIHIQEVDSTGLEWKVVGMAFCRFEVLFDVHRLYMSAMAAGSWRHDAAGVLRLYFRFLP